MCGVFYTLDAAVYVNLISVPASWLWLHMNLIILMKLQIKNLIEYKLNVL